MLELAGVPETVNLARWISSGGFVANWSLRFDIDRRDAGCRYRRFIDGTHLFSWLHVA